MPPVDVILHQDTSVWSSWVPPIITAFGSLLVAGIALVGVLIAANRSSAASREAAERSASASINAAKNHAKAMLRVERARARVEHRRHLRLLISNLLAMAMERVNHWSDLDEGQTDTATGEDILVVLAGTSEEFMMAYTVARMATSNERLREAIEEVAAAELATRRRFTRGEPANADELNAAAAKLAGFASALLSEEHS